VVASLLAAVEAPLKWALFDRAPLERWCAGRVALLGDACHAMLPYLAQGAAQAIEDAAVLANCLAAAGQAGGNRAGGRDTGAGNDVPAALAHYEAQRRERATRVQAMSRGNAERFHLPDGPAQRARDEAMAATFGLAPEIDWLYGTGPS
jgi:salicylate hydroxylase